MLDVLAKSMICVWGGGLFDNKLKMILRYTTRRRNTENAESPTKLPFEQSQTRMCKLFIYRYYKMYYVTRIDPVDV